MNELPRDPAGAPEFEADAVAMAAAWRSMADRGARPSSPTVDSMSASVKDRLG